MTLWNKDEHTLHLGLLGPLITRAIYPISCSTTTSMQHTFSKERAMVNLLIMT